MISLSLLLVKVAGVFKTKKMKIRIVKTKISLPPLRLRNEKGEITAVVIDFNDNGLFIRVKVPAEILNVRASAIQIGDYVTCSGDAAKFTTSKNDYVVVMACSSIVIHNKMRRDSWAHRQELDAKNSVRPQIETELLEL